MLGSRYGNVQQSGGSPPPFSPTSIAGCCLWLDGTDPLGTGTPPSPGASLPSWVDKSAQGNTCTQATSGRQPTYQTNIINGNASVLFLASSFQNVSMPVTGFPTGSAGRTFFFIVRPTDVAVNPNFFTYGNTTLSNRSFIFQIDTNDLANYSIFGFGNSTLTTAININNNYRLSMKGTSGASSSTFSYTINGITQSIGSSNASVQNTTSQSGFIGGGASGDYTGYLGEIIVYNNEISGGDFTSVQNYLSAKWGV